MGVLSVEDDEDFNSRSYDDEQVDLDQNRNGN